MLYLTAHSATSPDLTSGTLSFSVLAKRPLQLSKRQQQGWQGVLERISLKIQLSIYEILRGC